MNRARRLVIGGLALLGAAPAAAVPTEIVVRVLSQGAKFIANGTGGAMVAIVDAETGSLLAEGKVSGGTGDTKRIMPGGPRGAPIADTDAAAFRASVDIARPTLVNVLARGPMGYPDAAVTASTQRWLIPGQPVVGDGIVIELQGLVVRAAAGTSGTPTLGADVMMLCGCPIEAGGMWDAARFTVMATLPDGSTLPLAFAGRTGHFAARLGDRRAGRGTTITAIDSLTGATGVARIQ